MSWLAAAAFFGELHTFLTGKCYCSIGLSTAMACLRGKLPASSARYPPGKPQGKAASTLSAAPRRGYRLSRRPASRSCPPLHARCRAYIHVDGDHFSRPSWAPLWPASNVDETKCRGCPLELRPRGRDRGWGQLGFLSCRLSIPPSPSVRHPDAPGSRYKSRTSQPLNSAGPRGHFIFSIDLSRDGWPEKFEKPRVCRGRPPLGKTKGSTTIRLSESERPVRSE